MPAAAFDVLADVAEAVLAAAVEGLTADGVPIPDRRYIHGGPASTVAYDCEQIAVNLERLDQGGIVGAGGQRNQMPRPGATPLTAFYVCQTVACYPTVERAGNGEIDIPDPAEESAAARGLWSLAFSARRGVVARVNDKTLMDLAPDAPTERRGIGYESSEVEGLRPSTRSPSGGMAAMLFQVRVRL